MGKITAQPAKSEKTIVVAGGSGYLGKALCRRLLANGYRVVLVSRQPNVSYLPNHSNLVQVGYDALNTVENVYAAVNLCGENIAQKRWTKRRKQQLLDSRTLPTAVIGNAIREHWPDCKAYIGLSAIGYYAADTSRKLSEDAAAGDGFAAQLCQAVEGAIEHCIPTAVRRVILRSGVIIGEPEKNSYLGELWPLYQRHLGSVVGDGLQWFSWIHRGDIVSMIEYALEAEQVFGVINATAPNAIAAAELHKTLETLSHKRQWLRLPIWLVKLLFGELSELLLASHRVTPSRALQYGFRFKQPRIRAALRDALNTEGSRTEEH